MSIVGIVKKCIKRDTVAEKQLYYLFAPYIYSICKRYSKDNHQAKDYMQDGFQKIFEKLSQFDSEKGDFRNWVSRIVTNMIISDKRKQKKEVIKIEFDKSHEETIVDQIEEEVVREYLEVLSGEDILEALRLIPMKYSDVFNLYMIESRKHKEISELLKITESNSRSRLRRAKSMLKKILHKKVQNHQKKNISEEIQS